MGFGYSDVCMDQGKDTLKDLRSAIFYFENVADAKGDLERGNSIQATTRKLKDIVTSIEEGIKGLVFFLSSQTGTDDDVHSCRRED